MDETVEYPVKAIGIYNSKQVHPYEAGRQPDQTHQEGVIELTGGHNFEQALIGLEAGQLIWVLFIFHRNENWKPMVRPPRGGNQKIGVFATRSPYRPNQIGMSAVRVKKIAGLKIFVEGADLLDQSPIVDIKPYLSYADSFENETPRWLAEAVKFEVSWSEEAFLQWEFLKNDVPNLYSFVLHQLEYEPTNSQKKRVEKTDANQFVLAYRTWRIEFELAEQNVLIKKIFSGYSREELLSDEDPYLDKIIHRAFTRIY